MGVIVVPRILQEKLGEEGSDAFVKVIKEIDNEARKEALVVAEEHFEVRLSEEMGKLRQEFSGFKEEMRTELSEFKEEMKAKFSGFEEEIRTEFSGFKEEIKAEFSGFKDSMGREISSLKVENAKTKADMIKWMFIFWIGQIGVLSGIMFAIFKMFSG